VYVSLLRNKFAWKDVPDLAVFTSGIHLLYMSAVLAGLFAAVAEITCIARPTWPLWLSAVLAALAGLLSIVVPSAQRQRSYLELKTPSFARP
jgi:hypothetical protein